MSVTRVSAAGDVRWRDTYAPVDGVTNLRTLLRAPDGGFVFGGSVGADRYATQSGYLTKLAPDA